MHRILFAFISLTSSISIFARTDSTVFEPAENMHQQRIQELARNQKIIYLDGRPENIDERTMLEDSLGLEMLKFYYDQFRHFDDPAAPYFQFMSREEHLTLGIGGAVRMRGYFDFDGAVPAPAFSPYLIPIPSDPNSRRQFGTTPAGTCLFMRLIGTSKVFGCYQLYIEANFNGYNARDLHLKKAYAQFRDLTVGLAPSTFSDPSAQAPMVDANGPANKIADCNVLVRYMPSFGKRWSVAVSAESASSPPNYRTDSTCSKIRTWSPDFAAFLQYSWARDQHVRLAGIYRIMTYRDELTQTNHNKSGWGLHLSSVVRPLSPLTIYLTGCYGHGYTSVMNDLLIGSYDLLSDPLAAGRMYSPASYGWNVGVQWNFKPNLFASATMGQVRYLPGRKTEPSEYRRGQIIAMNIFWNPTPRSQFALEFDWGRRINQDRAKGIAHRIGAMCQFSF